MFLFRHDSTSISRKPTPSRVTIRQEEEIRSIKLLSIFVSVVIKPTTDGSATTELRSSFSFTTSRSNGVDFKISVSIEKSSNRGRTSAIFRRFDNIFAFVSSENDNSTFFLSKMVFLWSGKKASSFDFIHRKKKERNGSSGTSFYTNTGRAETDDEK